ncbi:adp-sugar pyrophosphatase [Nannochloropsis oceanica]
MAYVIKTEDHTVPGFRWVSLKRLQYCDAKGHKRTWEMAERITRRTPSEGPPPANGVGVVAIISTALEKDNDHIVLVSQFRPPVGKEVLELPAGLVDDGEDEATAAIRELREETGFEGIVTHVSPVIYSDPGLSNASIRYVFMKIDGDLGSNQQPVAIPDDGEIITVHRIPVKRLLSEVETFRDKGLEIDARLYGLALGLQYGDVKQYNPPGSHSSSWTWTFASGVAALLLYRYMKGAGG